MENVTRENSSMTIKTPLTSIAVSAISLLAAIRGHLLYFVLRYGSVECFAPTATESTPSSSKDTMPVMTYSGHSARLQENTDFRCDPDEKLRRLVEGCDSCDSVTLGEWLELVAIAALSGDQPQLNLDINHGGGIYSLHHCVTQLNLPTKIGPIMEYKH